MKFSVEAASKFMKQKKREAPTGQDGMPPKITKIDEIILTSKKATNAAPDPVDPVIIAICKITDQASDLIEDAPGNLYQIQIDQQGAGYRSCAFQVLRKRFNEFLSKHASNIEMLEKESGVVLVVTDGKEGNVYKPWRVAFYVPGDVSGVKNFLPMLDGYISHCFPGDQVRVHLHPHVGIDVSDVPMQNDLELRPPSQTLPLGVFDAQMPRRRPPVVLNLTIEDERTLSIVVGGNTYPYKSAFDASGVQGGYVESAGNEKSQYVRVLKSLTIPEDMPRVAEVIETILHRVVARVIVDGEVEEDSEMSAFMEKLKEFWNLYFV